MTAFYPSQEGMRVTDRTSQKPQKRNACDAVTDKSPQGRGLRMLAPLAPQVLIPFHRSEVLSIAEAAAVAGKTVRTLRGWCFRHGIGRRIGGQWAVSKVALAMHLDGDAAALRTYLAGDRSSPTVVAYFERCDVPLPGRSLDQEGKLSEATSPARLSHV